MRTTVIGNNIGRSALARQLAERSNRLVLGRQTQAVGLQKDFHGRARGGYDYW